VARLLNKMLHARLFLLSRLLSLQPLL